MGARPHGFTLIETLIAMAVLAILMTSGVPMYTQWIQNSQIRTAAESITNGLQVARNEAVRTSQQVRFEVTDPGSSGWRICAWDVVNDACLGAPIQERSAAEGGQNARLGGALVDAGNYVTALGAGAGLPAGVTFNAFGRSANPGFDLRRIDVRNPLLSAADERRLVILVSVGGQVRMCDPMHSRATNAQGC
ncbi:MAG: GspH/FimT family pseudopilin [Burkholderiales bacterium]